MKLTWGEPYIMTDEELAAEAAEAQREREELDRRWPPSQRRPRCPYCGCFTKLLRDPRTWRCNRCGCTERQLR